MALSCGFCGTEIERGYTACSACGAVLRRPPLMRAAIRLFLSIFALSAVFLIVNNVKYTIAAYSPILAGVFGLVFITLPMLAAIWFLVRRNFQRRWYK